MDTALEPDIQCALREHDFAKLGTVLKNWSPSSVESLLHDLPAADQAAMFALLPRMLAASCFAYLNFDSQLTLLESIPEAQASQILNDMADDDRTLLLQKLPGEKLASLLRLLNPTERGIAQKLLTYPEGSVGRLMTPHFIAVRADWTVKHVLDHIRLHGQNSETLSYLYVVDQNGKLIDDIRIHTFLVAATDTPVSGIMDHRFVALQATDNQDIAVRLFAAEDRKALPVLDANGILIGIVTIDDIMDIAEQRATREIQRIGGSEALDAPYMDIGFWAMVKKRASWLVILFLGEMLTATAMGAFEDEIAKAVVLALFLPLIISSGGNSGSQATTLVIRALALGEVKLKDWWRVLRREILSGLALGIVLGIIGFLRITAWAAVSTTYGPHWFLVALTVAVSLIGVVMWGSVVGAMLPFILRRAGLDPATASAPFVATLVDVTGLIIYFSVGMIILHNTLL